MRISYTQTREEGIGKNNSRPVRVGSIKEAPQTGKDHCQSMRC